MAKLNESFRSDLRFFAFYLANGTLCNDILGDFDYSEFLTWGSNLEMAFAIWSNVIQLDDEGNSLNSEVAAERVAQFIRRYIDKDYEVQPHFEPWETELHL